MVPCSYRYSGAQPQPRRPSSPHRPDKSVLGLRLGRTRSSPTPTNAVPNVTSTPSVIRSEKKSSHMPSPPKRMASEPATIHSDPVVIPPRSHSGDVRSPQAMRTNGSHGGRRARSTADHNSKSIPPAIAALLAVTAIPPPRRNSSRQRAVPMERRISIDELIHEWREEDKEPGSLGYNSPLDILLERPDDSDTEYLSGDESSVEKEKDFQTSRSVSSDSMPSVPSLDADERSLSSWSAISTPASVTRRLAFERKTTASSPPTEDCVLDHPLLHLNQDDSDGSSTPTSDIGTPKASPQKTKSSFKSNLTASLQALKSAAKSFSNFTAPSIPPDDLLTRSLLSLKYTSEMRPKPHCNVPEPALRRYLNPTAIHTPLSVNEMSMQLHEALSLQPSAEELEHPAVPMIQMQTYDRRSRSSSRKRRGSSQSTSGINPLSAAGRAMSPEPQIRQREPRENSDFLRIIVLEMNMRREGKLDAKALGRARIWLPPRQMSRTEDAVEERAVPNRWIGIAADEI